MNNNSNNSNNKILLTKEGEKKLNIELNNLINKVRPDVIEELKIARAQGDLSENADYDAARNRQAEVEGRIRQIEAVLHNVKIIKTTANAAVIAEAIIKLGATIQYAKLANKGKLGIVKTIKIVGKVEADPFKGTISNESPLAKAVINHAVDDIVKIPANKGVYKIKILDVKF